MGFKRSYFVKACWDKDSQVFWSGSDINGLHIETATLEEFEYVVREQASRVAVQVAQTRAVQSDRP